MPRPPEPQGPIVGERGQDAPLSLRPRRNRLRRVQPREACQVPREPLTVAPREGAQLAQHAVHLAQLVHEEVGELAIRLRGLTRLEEHGGAASRIAERHARDLAPLGSRHRDRVPAIPQRDEALGDSEATQDRLELQREMLAQRVNRAPDPGQVRARVVPHVAGGLERPAQLAMERRKRRELTQEPRKPRRVPAVFSEPCVREARLVEKEAQLP